MTTVRIVVKSIDADPKNAEGGRTITIAGNMLNNDIGHCAMTFATAADLERLRAAIDAN